MSKVQPALVYNNEALIGDFLGTIPTMQELMKVVKRPSFIIKDEIQHFRNIIKGHFHYLSESIGIDPEYMEESLGKDKFLWLRSDRAFQIAIQNDWYMTQAFLAQARLEVPEIPPKAELVYPDEQVPDIDYYISPFARSLPPEQKLSQEKWNELVKKLPNVNFGVLGNTKYDPLNYIQGDNVVDVYDSHIEKLCNKMKKSKGLISVVTGTSHLAFHLGVKNIVLNNQNFKWGSNPDGIHIRTYIPDLKVEEIIEYV